MAISALNKDGGLELKEIQTSLARAVKSSPKSSVVARYPKENYEIADLRLDIVANLAAIRQNPDASRTVKFVINVKMEDGSYFLDNNPERFKIEMSYNKFSNLSDITYARDVIIPLVDKLKAYENETGSVDEPDPFNAFDGVEEDIVINSESEFDEIKGLLENGQMIEAIKVYREITGLGLAEAKDAIDKYITNNNIIVPTNNQNNPKVNNETSAQSNESNSQQNTPDSSNSGCLSGAIMIGLFIIFLIIKLSDLF